ncbi:uncharacterized protein Tco025E_07756 [Trypanosoma conorhini]|uniref:Uncharacterized protein n=1 Tax=Trypanosoma conorhini TaxID=83891 RepID=A0A3R7LY06_9TRYP|nr:uncharacterized protein Tco025E_07756 [Trypanosoma conorhini]RNF05550.1 hypothetical protein Tco025E_07756 [Trypanosoma conorhini]
MRGERDEETRGAGGSSAKVLAREVGPGVVIRASTKQRRHSTRCLPDTAELTVGCAMSEVLHSGSNSHRPTLDAQLYLRRRVAEIVHQIESASSAHHFYRHVVEIDELLRCDAPMGFTPSMVVAGVPDILYMLADAVKRGYLLYPTEVDTGTVRALTPLRRSTVAPASIVPPATAAPLAATAPAAVGPHTAPAAERRERPARRSCTTPKNSARARVKCGADSSETATADLLPFLPPLVRRPVPPPSTAVAPGKNEDEAGPSAGADARRRITARVQPQYNMAGGVSTGKARMGEKSLRPRKHGATKGNASPETDSVRAAEPQPRLGAALDKQQQQQQQQPQLMMRSEEERHDTSPTPPAPMLRDLPSALQALLYHCALPLVCLTLEDQHQRTTAVRLLASAMASILRVTSDSVQLKPMHGIAAEAGAACSNGDVVCSEENEVERDASAPPFNEILCRIRHAALVSLNVLMTHIDAEELTCVNRHFASRDKRKYEEAAVATLPRVLPWKERKQADVVHEQVDEGQVPVTNLPPSASGARMGHVLRLADSCFGAPRTSPREARRQRTVPLSIYNGAVAVDVFRPLIERWTTILRNGVAANALLDSSRQLFRHPALVQAGVLEQGEDENAATAVTLTMEPEADIGPSTKRRKESPCVFVSKTRMEEDDAEEIYLLLRVCLHLSTYKQHARCLIAPDDSSDAACASLPVLLCLTMARCAEGDKCLALCVECLWNLLEVAPEETVTAILRHSVQPAEPAHYEKGRPLSSLSASESLLYCFLQVLLTGHRLRQRELRNDMVVLFMLILKSGTAMLRRRQAALQHSAEAAAYTPLPPVAIHAINVLAATVFDMVCGPELREYGRTAQMTRRPVETFLRYHTVLSPTTRVENVQFKLLGWRMLEAFYEWQNARLVVEHLSRDHGPTASDGAPVDSVDDHCAGYEHADEDNALIFDLCRHGFIHALLLYVDTMCSEEPVVAWSREELLTLQEEAWYVLLGLMDSAVAAAAASAPLQADTGRSEASALALSDAATSSTSDENVMALLPLVKADTQFVAAGGILCAVRYIREVTTRDAEALVSLAVCVLSVLSRCPAHRPELLTATMSTSPSMPSVTESVPLLLVVVTRFIQGFLQQGSRTAALPSLLASSKPLEPPKGSRPSSHTSHSDTIPSTLSGVGDGRLFMRSKATADDPLRCAGAAMETLPTAVEFNFAPEGNRSEKAYFTAGEVEVVIHCLLLLKNIVGGDPADAVTTQRAFLSLGGVPLLLALARISSAALLSTSPPPSKVDGGRNELLLVVLDCFRTFILGNAVAQAQFVQGDGVHVLLSMIAALVGCWQRAAPRDAEAITAGDSSPLAPALTFLADVLHECEEAREAFLQWSTNDLPKSRDTEDDDCTSATQLLLSLWGEEAAAGHLEHTTATALPQRATAREAATEDDDDAADVHSAGEGAVAEAQVARKKEMRVSKASTEPNTADGGGCPGNVSATSGGCAKPSETPLLHPERWGLGLLGIHDRKSLKEELENRYNELQHTNAEEVEGGAAPDATTRRARRRLAASLHSVLGMRAKVYACFAAVGFSRLVNVKTSAAERVKLLHAAALPSLCEDEVWAAMAEAVDLHDQAVVVPPHGAGKEQAAAGEAEDASRAPFIVDPIIPDADQLVQVLLDVEARTTELQGLSQLCLDMRAAHRDEATQRFLLSRLRQGTEDGNVLALVRRARSRFDPISSGNAGSILDHVMSRFGRRGTDHVELISVFSSPLAGTATAGSRRLSTPRLTLLQKRRKRDAMIKSSYRKS